MSHSNVSPFQRDETEHISLDIGSLSLDGEEKKRSERVQVATQIFCALIHRAPPGMHGSMRDSLLAMSMADTLIDASEMSLSELKKAISQAGFR